MEVIIVDEKSLEEKISNIRSAGSNSLHILSDFDRTVTKEYVNGEKIPSLISILRLEGHLTEDYPGKAHELFDKYHPIEINAKIPMEERVRAMDQWWIDHFKLLIESGLNKNDIKQAVKSRSIMFREYANSFFDLLNKNKIPLVFISASGLGISSISLALERDDLLYDNVHIVSNDFEWDEKGNALKYKEPIIHVFNKDETVVHEFPFYDEVKDRKNVILLGDSLGDPGMIEGFDYDNLIKIGFYNSPEHEHIEEYKEKFDVIITGDGDFSYINQLLERMLS